VAHFGRQLYVQVSPEEASRVAKIVECSKINNIAGCTVVVRADTEPEVINLMQEHTKTHGLPPNPQLAIKIKARIRDE
jgi:predicted small metal-binding protein